MLIPLCRIHHLTRTRTIHSSSSSATITNMAPSKKAPPPPTPSKPLKILMLHGYTQSGASFHKKTRAVEKHLQKQFPNHIITLVFPTGPMKLIPSDIPGNDNTDNNNNDADIQQEAIEAYGWWRRHDISTIPDAPEYEGIDATLNLIAQTLKDSGPFDGIIGFSQGAVAAAMITSLLEQPERIRSFATAAEKNPHLAIPFPESFLPANLQHPRLKFCVAYCGFAAPGPRYEAFWSEPKISTPMLHVWGSLDSVVEEAQSRTLVEACEGGFEAVEKEEDGGRVALVRHPGGHFLPCQKVWLGVLSEWVGKWIGETKEEVVVEEKNKEVSVQDMDVPF